VSDPSHLYSWRCDDCGERESVDSSDEAEASARGHRTVTQHGTIFTVGPEGETRA
jgi:hypothetical protein